MNTITEMANNSAYSYGTIKAEALGLLRENIDHFSGDRDEVEETLYEVVDNVVPHSYGDILACILSDGLDLAFEDSDNIPSTKSLTDIMQARIAEQIRSELEEELDGLISEWEEEQEEEE